MLDCSLAFGLKASEGTARLGQVTLRTIATVYVNTPAQPGLRATVPGVPEAFFFSDCLHSRPPVLNFLLGGNKKHARNSNSHE